VRELYSRPEPSPREIVRAIVAALDPETRTGMSDPAVVTCLGVLIEGTQQVAAQGLPATLAALGVGQEPVAVQMAAGLRSRAQQLITQQRWASRPGDLAVEAIGTTALALAALQAEGVGFLEVQLAAVQTGLTSLAQTDRLHEVAELFVGHKLDRAFRHFVARDLQEFVGGVGVPTVSHANRLEDAVAAHCREGCAALDLGEYEQVVRRVHTLDAPGRVRELTPVMAQGVYQGLTILS